MTSYLLEFRLSGSARRYVRQLAYDVARRFNVRGATEKRVVPHATLVGPFSTTDEKRLIHALEDIGNNYDLITFRLNGFRSIGNWLTGNRVLAVKIEPSLELNTLRSDLVHNLAEYCKLNKYDKKEFKPHATVAFRDIDKKFGQIKKLLNSTSSPPIQHHVLRITLLKGARILYEYDFLQRRLLTRFEALNRNNRKTTLMFLRRRLEGTDVGYSPGRPLTLSPKSRTFLISDTHFDHANIIRYCNRPFRTKEEMNEALIRNWNRVVGISDAVYFLGDLTFGPNNHSADYWLGKLNGRKFFIRGGHDADLITRAVEIPNNYVIQYMEHSFLLAHKPSRPAYWNYWIIHGDKHNNDMAGFPFINRVRKTINVSVEVINYRPISVDDIATEIARA